MGVRLEGGLHVKGLFNKRNEPGKELVSVITVCFNARETLENTIKSVLAQTYENIEYIIIDGGSCDGTIDIIRKYEGSLAYWVSEKDSGFYDAMNKGIGFATGGIISFLNSDDLFYDADAISQAIIGFEQDKKVGIVYGRTEYFSDTFNFSYSSGKKISHPELWKGVFVCHQSMLYRKELFDILGRYDTKFKIVADHEFLLRFFKEQPAHGYKDIFIDTIISKFRLHGASSKNIFLSANEEKLLTSMYFKMTPYKHAYLNLRFLKYCLVAFMIKIGIRDYYRKLKYSLFYKTSRRN
jgi:glycosyltransferase involved in cell wall biosynthesis